LSPGTVWHRTQSAIGSWAGSVWTAYDGFLSQVAAETNADGRVELFGVNHAGQIYHRVQSRAGDWTGSSWLGVDGQLSAVALARNVSGKLEVFGTNPYGDLWHRTQTAPGSNLASARSATEDGRGQTAKGAHRNVGSGGRPQESGVGRTLHHANRALTITGAALPRCLAILPRSRRSSTPRAPRP
jgi:hypothetical protein